MGERLEPGDRVVRASGSAGGRSLRNVRLRLSAPFWRWPWLRAVLELLPPLAWFFLLYLTALAVLFVSAFWSVDPFTTEVVHSWNTANFREIVTSADWRRVVYRTVGIAAAVTITDAVLAFPFAYYMARLASPRTRAALFVLVLLPLWSSYLVRVYAWKVILAQDGILNWSLEKIGLPGANIGYTNTAMWLVFSYIWLPFMILPIYASLERIPDSYIEASSDLGGRGFRTLRSVILPLALPGIVAGSIFTFSLTLGDYITPTLVGGASSSFIGNIVYNTGLGAAGNLPFAAAFAAIPLLVMAIYLLLARRLGAFEAL
jgi:putative spermidine/putrescine transport system permease protein